MNFENIIGNDNIKRNLEDIITKNKLSHSYIFEGQDGIGKKIFAEEFAKMSLCLSKEEKECSKCESCNKFLSLNHPDFLKIEPEGNSIKIAQIRELQEDVYKKPIISNKKVFIINNAECMTEEAQNCLLKTLEEPPEYMVIILITSNENMLLNTIKSRCIKIHFNNIDKNQILDYILKNNLIENPTENIIEFCNGSIGKAQKIKENIEIYTSTEKVLQKLIDGKYYNVGEAIREANFIYKEKENINNLLDYIIVIIYSNLKKQSDNSEIVNRYFDMINIVQNAKNKLKANANFEMCIDEIFFLII